MAMLNFRVLDDDARRIDAACKIAGMSRSDFIRKAVGEAVARYTGDQSPIRTDDTSVKGKDLPFPDCPRSAACSITKSQDGRKICRGCGNLV